MVKSHGQESLLSFHSMNDISEDTVELLIKAFQDSQIYMKSFVESMDKVIINLLLRFLYAEIENKRRKQLQSKKTIAEARVYKRVLQKMGKRF